jgi:hypothetical protein
VVWEVTEPAPEYDVRVVTSQTEPDGTPIPNHEASDTGETPPEPPKRKRSLFGSAPKSPGTQDFQPPKVKDQRPVPPIPRGGFAPQIEKMYGTLAMAAMAIDMPLGMAILEVAPAAAQAWDELARRNITVRRVIVSMLETSAWGAVIAAHLPIFMLFIKRAAGNDPRFSALGAMIGDEAERHANGDTE